MKGMDDDGSDINDDATLDQDAQWHQISQHHYDPDQNSGLTTAIVYALAEAGEIDPTDLKSPQLYNVVDVPAIENALFNTGSNGDTPPGTGTVEFHYAEYLVKVRSDGWIQVYEIQR